MSNFPKNQPRPPLLSSKQAGWDGVLLEHHRQPPLEVSEHCFAQHVISIHVGSPIQLERQVNGKFVRSCFSCGDIIVSPPNLYHSAYWEEEAEFLILSIEPAIIAHAAYDLLNPDRLEIMPLLKARDPLIQHMGLALKAELEATGEASRLYAESLFNALCVHLIQRYSTSKQQVPTYSGGLPRHKLRRAIAYINEHLEKNLTITEIAETVGMSPYHFARAFKQSTGIPPHRYLVERRIEQAKILLNQTDLSVAQIATRVGFATPSHFTTVFRKHLKTTPNAYRRSL